MPIALLSENKNNSFIAIGLIANLLFMVTIILGIRHVLQVKNIVTYSVEVLLIYITANILLVIYGFGSDQAVAVILGSSFAFYYISLLFMKVVLRRDMTFWESIYLFRDNLIKKLT